MSYLEGEQIVTLESVLKRLAVVELALARQYPLNLERGNFRQQLLSLSEAGELDEDAHRLVPEWHQLYSAYVRIQRKRALAAEEDPSDVMWDDRVSAQEAATSAVSFLLWSATRVGCYLDQVSRSLWDFTLGKSSGWTRSIQA